MNSPTELRRAVHSLQWSAAGSGALAVVLRLAVIFWWQPVAWHMPSSLGLVTTLAVTFVAVAVPLAAYVRQVRRHRGLPRTLLIGRGSPAYAVPTSPWVGCYLVMGMAIAAGTVATVRTGDGGVDLADMGWLPAVLVAEALLMAAIWPVLRGPGLELVPEGVVVRGWRSGPTGRTIPWDTVVPGSVPAPSHRAWRVRLPLRPVHHSLRTVPVGVGWRWVDPVFLLGAIQHYAEHAEHRAAIGTPGELERLSRMLEKEGMVEVSATEPTANHATEPTANHATEPTANQT
ncbi:MAG TPA: hypothetical protein VFR67_11330 [Pilimelia sp.]|nr:hypothetical protein [Pilimelia sp.]